MEIFTSSSQHLSIGGIYGIRTTPAFFSVRRGLPYNVTPLYDIRPGLWIIFRALWIVPGTCKKGFEAAKSLLGSYDSVADFPLSSSGEFYQRTVC